MNDDLALDATMRAAAPYQCKRSHDNLAICIEPQDIREKVRERKTSTLLVFVVDASGSMGTKLMTETKGAIMYLLMEAYQKRDRVCMLAFKGDGSEILLPPTDSIELAKQKLEELPTGGKTPLCSGLIQGYEVVRNSLRKNPDILPLLVLITDGRANVGANKNRSYEGIFHSRLYEELYAVADAMAQEPRLRCMVIDAEEKRMGAFGKAQKLAERMGAKYLVLEELRSGNIAKAVREELGR
jgi:magnesium chelatase subunit D